MKNLFIIVGILLPALVWGILSTGSVASAQGASTCAYAQETGHNIHGLFLEYYLAHNGAANFGMPLTEAFIENGFLVQYFQRARMELHPENPEPFRVLLGLLGEQYGIFDAPIKVGAIPTANNPNFHYYPNTGQAISFAFKKYFDSHGGVDVFGYPITGVHFENGEFVQYFQRQRLIWNPLDTSANAIRPSPVGELVLDKVYPANHKWRVRTLSDSCSNLNELVTHPMPVPTPQLKITASPMRTAMSLFVRVMFRQPPGAGPQYVEVLVEDSNAKPVAGVALYSIVRFPTGDKYYPLMETNATGKSTFSFDLNNQLPNSVIVVDVYGFLDTATATGRDTFVVYR
jgi:hypothetical protein